MDIDPLGALMSFLGSLVAAALVFLLVVLLGRHERKKVTGQADSALKILFKDDRVLDASPSFALLAEMTQTPIETWDDLRNLFAWRFPNWPENPPEKTLELLPEDSNDLAKLTLQAGKNVLRITLVEQGEVALSKHALMVGMRRNAKLVSMIDQSPDPVWETDLTGARVWENKAYRDLGLAPETQDVFQKLMSASLRSDLPAHRHAIDHKGQSLWFDFSAFFDGQSTFHHARDVSVEVAAETARLSFVQSLSRTFAYLSTGLAVFNRNRQLVLFNPALVDLTGLNVEFLSSRPDLASFFDRLRDLHMVPEPKNYGDWREEISRIVQSSSETGYAETWNLTDGVTFRVTGRPHPEGAVAFLFDDISNEILQTRRFRAQLDLSQSALDALPDAIVLFSPGGNLALTNERYRALWDHDPETALVAEDMQTTLDALATLCRPTPVWDRIVEAVQNNTSKMYWQGPVQRLDGQRLICEVTPLEQGNVMVRFGEAQFHTSDEGAEFKHQFGS